MSTDGDSDGAVSALIGRLTADLEGVATAASGGVTEFKRGAHMFAALHGSRVSLRLRPDIAVAALRTSATSPSGRGPEWIEFEPDSSDPHDIDRLQAWIIIAWRAAQPPH